MIGTIEIRYRPPGGTTPGAYTPIREAARLIGESRRNIDRRIAAGEMRSVKIAGITCLRTEDVASLMASRGGAA
ncbi:hypothetical protein [Stackebrandtia soli]|uniref:hypothetical protein n=1 Tax=Stackebrandtia soli TaxID=1892856 RepID=UPI0039E82570